MTRVILVGDSHLALLGDAPETLDLPGIEGVLNAAEGAAGAGNLLDQVRRAGVTGDDVLVVSVGSNDAAPGQPLAVDEFGGVLRALLDEVTPARTVLLVAPGVDEERLSDDGERAAQGVAAYAERAAALFGAAGAKVVEAWVLIAPLQARAFADDGRHLSEAGYDVLLPALREAIAAVAGTHGRPATSQ
jgi:lysophospholipase L1-like esterase